MMDLARVQKELNECNRDVQVSGIRVSLKADSLTHLIGSIPGPQGTPYEGGVFKIDITLPGNFFFFSPPTPERALFCICICGIISKLRFFTNFCNEKGQIDFSVVTRVLLDFCRLTRFLSFVIASFALN